MVQYSLSLNLQDNTLSIKSVIEFTKKKNNLSRKYKTIGKNSQNITFLLYILTLKQITYVSD